MIRLSSDFRKSLIVASLYYHYDVRAHSKREAEKIWNRENKAGNPRFQVTDPDVIGFADVYDVHLKEEDDHGKHRRTEEVL